MPGDGSKQAEQMEIERHNQSLSTHRKDILELCCVNARFREQQTRTTPVRTAMFTIERRTEMFRKLPMIAPIAILLSAASVAPAAAQVGSHRLPNQARAYNAYALVPSDAQSSA